MCNGYLVQAAGQGLGEGPGGMYQYLLLLQFSLNAVHEFDKRQDKTRSRQASDFRITSTDSSGFHTVRISPDVRLSLNSIRNLSQLREIRLILHNGSGYFSVPTLVMQNYNEQHSQGSPRAGIHKAARVAVVGRECGRAVEEPCGDEEETLFNSYAFYL